MRRQVLGAVLASVVAVVATGCGGDDDATNNEARTITVWMMEGDLSDQAVAAIGTKFTEATGASVDLQIQQWDEINTKISTALAQNDPPDVVAIGNTNVPLFAASGGLLDITDKQSDLSAGQTWLPGLAGPATVDGKLYAAPLFAGNRAVVYNKKIWADAGVTAPPKTFAELKTALDKIKAKNTAKDFSPFYLPGQYWFGAVQFLWDAGGQLAVKNGDAWAGGLSSPESIKGLTAWKDFQNAYSVPASRNVGNRAPDQAALFADGKVGAIVDSSIKTILKNKPELEGDIGTFPFPSLEGDGTQPVFLGGTDLAIPVKSKDADLALEYLKAATSPEVQKEAIVGLDGWTPVSTELIAEVSGTLPETSQAFVKAAQNSVATPATAGWATIETDQSLSTFFADIATGRKTVADAAKDFDAHLAQALNAS
ncbi:extracellular solute-binding protein [Actinocorallia sp. A-T 12471]|uniref:extracellular solute-binding protein n=1 Tax=Actinocorallia sp. A-T 12471 TaxID=3089813 RepID=UPI0029D1DD27|nr:extracellular solute-binding protein [Actinocorallia sp. A-T 12471]MDX6739518.1 extracellular solute-binding protein [Actinocorallia sp. A-T 12471]